MPKLTNAAADAVYATLLAKLQTLPKDQLFPAIYEAVAITSAEEVVVRNARANYTRRPLGEVLLALAPHFDSNIADAKTALEEYWVSRGTGTAGAKEYNENAGVRQYTLSVADKQILEDFVIVPQQGMSIYYRPFLSKRNVVRRGSGLTLADVAKQSVVREGPSNTVGESLYHRVETKYRAVVEGVRQQYPLNDPPAPKSALPWGMSFDPGEPDEDTGERKPFWKIASLLQYLEGILPFAELDETLRLLREPMTITNSAEECAFFYFDEIEDCYPMPTPYTDGFLETIPDMNKLTFMAWVYSLFLEKTRSRQSLWLQSFGFTGKTQFVRALSSYLTTDCATFVNDHSFTDSFNDWCIGKRLAVYDDCTDRSFLRTKAVKQYTGQGGVMINVKNGPKFSANVEMRVLITSNYFPFVDAHDQSERSRLIVIEQQVPSEETQRRYLSNRIDPLTKNKLEKGFQKDGKQLWQFMLEEMPGFLYKCKEAFYELVQDDTDQIPVNEEAYMHTEELCSSGDSEEWSNWFLDRVVFIEPEEWEKRVKEGKLETLVTRQKMQSLFRNAFSTTDNRIYGAAKEVWKRRFTTVREKKLSVPDQYSEIVGSGGRRVTYLTNVAWREADTTPVARDIRRDPYVGPGGVRVGNLPGGRVEVLNGASIELTWEQYTQVYPDRARELEEDVCTLPPPAGVEPKEVLYIPDEECTLDEAELEWDDNPEDPFFPRSKPATPEIKQDEAEQPGVDIEIPDLPAAPGYLLEK